MNPDLPSDLSPSDPSLMASHDQEQSGDCVVVQEERLDRYLAKQWPNLSRSRFQKLIEAGQVRHNDTVCTNKKLMLAVGDRLQVTIPAAQPLNLEPQAIPLDILYEDRDVIVVNKPAGMVVHPSAGHTDGTLVNALLAHCQTLPGMDMPAINGVKRPGVVHRLDRDTTGAIMFAKTDLANQHLQAQLRHKTAHREYLGVVFGSPRHTDGIINKPVGRNPNDRKRQAIVPEEKGGRHAITHWFVEERLGNFTLMRFELKTGRTHQIRIHCTDMGHPMVGDRTYGSSRTKIGVNLPGQALHAWKLRFMHPRTGEIIATEAPIPKHFNTLLEVLRQRSH